MPKITKRWLDSLKPSELDAVYWDSDLKGFGARASGSGRIAFILQYRNAQGRSRRLTVGSYGRLTAEEARKEARLLLADVERGHDPAEARAEERKAIGFKELATEYLDKARRGLIIGRSGKPKRQSTVEIDEYRMPHLVGFFGHKPVKDIARADCQRCLEHLIAGKHGAARTFGLLGGVLSYAVTQGYLIGNPAHAGIRKPADGRREFSLDEAGYRALGKALETAERQGEHWQAVAAIRLLALTGCRKSEILCLEWDEVDFVGRAFRFRPERIKAGPVRPLSDAAIEVLRAIQERPHRYQGQFVLYGARSPRKPFNGLGAASEGAWTRIVGGGYTPHGLRHAFASAAGELGYSELTIGALLGHARSSTTAGYIKLDRVLISAADQVSQWIAAAMAAEPIGGGAQ